MRPSASLTVRREAWAPVERVLSALYSLCDQLDEAGWAAIITASWRAGEVEGHALVAAE